MDTKMQMQLMLVLLSALIALVGWVGHRIYAKVDSLEEKQEAHNTDMVQRVTRMETKLDLVEKEVEHIKRQRPGLN